LGVGRFFPIWASAREGAAGSEGCCAEFPQRRSHEMETGTCQQAEVVDTPIADSLIRYLAIWYQRRLLPNV